MTTNNQSNSTKQSLTESLLTTKKFLSHVESEDTLNIIYNDIDDKNPIQPITVSFYGQTIQIDNNADHYEAFCTFLRTVIKNDEEYLGYYGEEEVEGEIKTLHVSRNGEFFELLLPDNTFRYDGTWEGIQYSIFSATKKTEKEINEYLINCDTDFIIERQGYTIDMDTE